MLHRDDEPTADNTLPAGTLQTYSKRGCEFKIDMHLAAAQYHTA
jgi:hypothetical protein